MDELNLTSAIKEYEALVSFNRIPDYTVESQTPTKASGEIAKNKHCVALIISNTSSARNVGKFGTTITEHWMLFPEEIERAVESTVQSVCDTEYVVTVELCSFKDLQATVEIKSVDVMEKLMASVRDNTTNINQELKKVGYEAEVKVQILDK
uniref:uncharacterized protein LOC100178004 isoform X2 n=1 Tax=Ciona intestinalis TaxID=7719 RepID=UPI0005218783|nr:uncharacterized protein LOC100178004 isoform X2 [Ciona intestinalis]|eukprot:XP_009858814.1 uncharacterized protein LOC100178004 isoform X2 [Ciona intestinalis]